MFLGNQTVGTKQLTFFFSFERLGDCCGLIKAFGEGWLRQRVGMTERTMRWTDLCEVSDLETDLCEVRAWECESVHGSALCEREGEGEGQWECRLICVRVRSEALFFNLAYLKLKFLKLGFTFSKPSLRDLRSTWPNSTWHVHVESDHIRRQKPSLKGSI